MSISYLERYLAGEREQVYEELMALGAAVYAEPLASDARAVAVEMMRRALHNVMLIIARLRELGYVFEGEHRKAEQWSQPSAPHEALDGQSFDALAQIDAEHGPVPLTVYAWYAVVGNVDLMGDHPTLSSYYDREGPASDPLVVWFNPFALEEYRELCEDDPASAEEPFGLDFAPDAYHKANISGGGPSSFELGQPEFDALIRSEDWDGVYCIPYLRECFAWGGFPGLKDDANAAAVAAEELALLRRDLLPI